MNIDIVSGYNYAFSLLICGDTTGQITCWNIPTTGLNFTPFKTWKAHNGWNLSIYKQFYAYTHLYLPSAYSFTSIYLPVVLPTLNSMYIYL